MEIGAPATAAAASIRSRMTCLIDFSGRDLDCHNDAAHIVDDRMLFVGRFERRVLDRLVAIEASGSVGADFLVPARLPAIRSATSASSFASATASAMARTARSSNHKAMNSDATRNDFPLATSASTQAFTCAENPAAFMPPALADAGQGRSGRCHLCGVVTDEPADRDIDWAFAHQVSRRSTILSRKLASIKRTATSGSMPDGRFLHGRGLATSTAAAEIEHAVDTRQNVIVRHELS